ncbi:unnamed protein product, partial [Ectocarpus sp. 12 AP-2014]
KDTKTSPPVRTRSRTTTTHTNAGTNKGHCAHFWGSTPTLSGNSILSNTIITREATNNSSSHRIHTQCRNTRRSPCCMHTPAIETNTARSVHICQGAFSFRS